MRNGSEPRDPGAEEQWLVAAIDAVTLTLIAAAAILLTMAL